MREFETTWKATKQAVFDTVAPATDYVADAEARRQQRLAELLAEFEAARLAAWQITDKLNFLSFEPENAVRIPSIYNKMINHCCLDFVNAARRYIIARDFNEFNPGKADMLWKLQNGGAV